MYNIMTQKLDADGKRQFEELRRLLDALKADVLRWGLNSKSVKDLTDKVSEFGRAVPPLKEGLYKQYPFEDVEGCPKGWIQCDWGCSPGPTCTPILFWREPPAGIDLAGTGVDGLGRPPRGPGLDNK